MQASVTTTTEESVTKVPPVEDIKNVFTLSSLQKFESGLFPSNDSRLESTEVPDTATSAARQSPLPPSVQISVSVSQLIAQLGIAAVRQADLLRTKQVTHLQSRQQEQRKHRKQAEQAGALEKPPPNPTPTALEIFERLLRRAQTSGILPMDISANLPPPALTTLQPPAAATNITNASLPTPTAAAAATPAAAVSSSIPPTATTSAERTAIPAGTNATSNSTSGSFKDTNDGLNALNSPNATVSSMSGGSLSAATAGTSNSPNVSSTSDEDIFNALKALTGTFPVVIGSSVGATSGAIAPGTSATSDQDIDNALKAFNATFPSANGIATTHTTPPAVLSSTLNATSNAPHATTPPGLHATVPLGIGGPSPNGTHLAAPGGTHATLTPGTSASLPNGTAPATPFSSSASAPLPNGSASAATIPALAASASMHLLTNTAPGTPMGAHATLPASTNTPSLTDIALAIPPGVPATLPVSASAPFPTGTGPATPLVARPTTPTLGTTLFHNARPPVPPFVGRATTPIHAPELVPTGTAPVTPSGGPATTPILAPALFPTGTAPVPPLVARATTPIGAPALVPTSTAPITPSGAGATTPLLAPALLPTGTAPVAPLGAHATPLIGAPSLFPKATAPVTPSGGGATAPTLPPALVPTGTGPVTPSGAANTAPPAGASTSLPTGMASATPTGAHANLAAGATAATPAPAAKPAVNPSRSLILTDEDMLRLTPTLNWHRRYSGGDLRDGHILSSMNKDDLQTIIRYLNANKRLCIKVSGNKEEVRQRLQSVLFPNSSGYGTPKHSPSPTIPPASALTIIEKETTENQERAWKTLFATFHSEFEFVEEVWSKRFLHPNSTRKQSTLITNLDPTSITRLHELTTTPEHRFLIFLYSDQHRSFLSEGTIRRAFQIKINHARVAHSLYPLVNTQYVDITTYIRIHNPLTKYPLDVAGPTCWWPSGMISIICVRPLTAEKAVVSNCYQTLKELGCDAPYTVPPAGFSAFAQPTLSLGEVTTVLADKLCSMTTPTTAAQDPTQNDDIEIGEQIMSFKCPLTLLRIQVPVKGSQCLHRQCFDALSFFTMTTGPMKTRKCPICAKTLNSNDIKMDLTCARLLAKYPDADKCMILPNGDDKPYDENAKPVRTVLADADLNVSVETSKRKRSEGGDPVRVIDLDSDNDMPFEKRLRLSSPRSGMPSWNGAVIDLD